MTLVQLFLVHRYGASSIHYLTPTDDNAAQAERMRDLGLFSTVQTEIGQIIVGQVDRARVAELVAAAQLGAGDLIRIGAPGAPGVGPGTRWRLGRTARPRRTRSRPGNGARPAPAAISRSRNRARNRRRSVRPISSNNVSSSNSVRNAM